MRLLNAKTVKLHNNPSRHPSTPDVLPPYAILSHTWSEQWQDEVSFEDFGHGTEWTKPGYRKIQQACGQAVADDWDWIWIDTCCIDKSSSAELTEAINSMYNWYRDAQVCYAYLADVPANVGTLAADSAFARSKWFTRGWTLQELIAPTKLVFFSQDDPWQQIGTKSELFQVLSKITRIGVDVLQSPKMLEMTSIAKIMSWMRDRSTRRSEDMAYCLLGLFGVNMPMLYGEREHAFIRLQEEIMKGSDDQSLFAWKWEEVDAFPRQPPALNGLLARHPKYFATSDSIVAYADFEYRKPFSASNRGLCIDLHLRQIEPNLFVAALACPPPDNYKGFLGIYLQRISDVGRQYARIRPREFCRMDGLGPIETVYVRQRVVAPNARDMYPKHSIQLRKGPRLGDDYALVAMWTSETMWTRTKSAADGKVVDAAGPVAWVPKTWPFVFELAKGVAKTAIYLEFERVDGARLVVMLGSTVGFGIGFQVVSVAENEQSSGRRLLHFDPNTTGEMIVGDHRVRVVEDIQVRDGCKYYVVDLALDAVEVTEKGTVKYKNVVPQLDATALEASQARRQSNSACVKRKGLFKLAK